MRLMGSNGLVVMAVCFGFALGCAGEDGARGAKGEDGAPGEAGPAGTDGAMGLPGVAGPAGERGEQGETGATGETGPQGQEGEPGKTGPQGETGEIGPQGEKGDPGQGAGGADSVSSRPVTPGFVLLDKDGQQVEAWILAGPTPPYGQTSQPKCVWLEWIGQRAAWELQLDLQTGTFEPCYPDYPSWTKAGQAGGYQAAVFNSTDCTGTAYAAFTPVARVKIAGKLYEANGTLLGAIGAGTGKPASYYNGESGCVDASSQTFDDLRGYVPVLPEFASAFDNPPYSVKIAY